MYESKYNDIINVVKKEYEIMNLDKFSEKMVKIIYDLENDNITKNYTKKDWDNVMNYIAEFPIPALFVPAFKSPNLPTDCFIKIYEITDTNTDIIPLFSEYVPDHIVKNFSKFYYSKMYDILSWNYKNISNKTFKYFCNNYSENELSNIEFLPFRLLKYDKKNIGQLLRLVNNEDKTWFYNDNYETFLTQIINNETMPKGLRNKAFNIGYIPKLLYNKTDYITEELYKSYADSIFELSGDVDNNLMLTASNELVKWVKNNELPTSCQIDFLERANDIENLDQHKENVIDVIISHTRNPDILRKCMKFKDKKVREIVFQNKRTITDDIMVDFNRCEKTREQLINTFIKSCFFNKFSFDWNKSMLSLDNPYLTRAVIANENSDIDLFVINSTKNNNRNELRYMKYIKENISSYLSFPFSQKILCYAGRLFLNIDYQTNGSPNVDRESLRMAYNYFYPDDWYAIPETEYKIMKKMMESLKEKFPEFNNISDKIINKIEKTYKNSNICFKYPEIFEIKKFDMAKNMIKMDELSTCKEIPCSHINHTELLNYSDKKLKELIQDVIELNDIKVCEAVRWAMIRCCNLNYYEQHKVYKAIHKLTDSYNELTEFLQLKIKEKEIER